MDGAVIELNALTDADGAGTEHDDGVPPVSGEVPCVAQVVEGGIEIGGLGLELCRAGIDHLIAGQAVGERTLCHASQPSQGLVQVAVLFALEIQRVGHGVLDLSLVIDQVLQLADEPLVDFGDVMDVLHAHALGQGLKDGEQTQVIHGSQPLVQAAAGGVVVVQAVQLDLRAAHGLHQRGLKGMLDGHDLAGGLHLGAKLPAGPVELIKGPLGELDHHIVHRRLEAGVGFAGHVVLDFVQGIAQGDLGCDLGDGVAGGLGSQRGGPGDSGIDLDDGILKAVGVQGELAVTATLDAHLLDDLQCGRAEHLILFVRQSQRRGHDDRVAGVDAHGVKVLHGADRDGRALVVAHDLKLDLFPAEDILFDQDLRDGGVVQTNGTDLPQLFLVVGHAAAAAAQGCAPRAWAAAHLRGEEACARL